MSLDHKVDFLSEETLARFANDLRRRARKKGRYLLDIIDLIERVLVEYFAAKGGLRIDIFEGDKFDEPACVTYRPLTLHVRRNIWEDAARGVSAAYFILAHEIAHLLFHDHRALAFSSDPSLRMQFAAKEYSAEWQADTFAKHLTMPDDAVRQLKDAHTLALVCNVEDNTAAERVAMYARTGPMLPVKFEGEPCNNCNNFTLVRDGLMLKCETCEWEQGCL
jgi:hypothetical protein